MPAVYEELDAALHALAEFRYLSREVETTSAVPGGRLAHRIAGKVVRRHIDDVLRQQQQYADTVTRAITLLAEIAVQKLDDLEDGIAELRRTTNELRAIRDVT
jgi:hypothetical protein